MVNKLGGLARRRTHRIAGLAGVLWLATAGAAMAQEALGEAKPAPSATAGPPPDAPAGDGILPVGCSSCGALPPPPPPDLPFLGAPPRGGCSACGDGCNSGACKPGRKRCCNEFGDGTCVQRFCSGLFECLCCPDPCYDPVWLPVANAAFFVDTVRPQSMMRFRYEYGNNVVLPDRAEFFWAMVGKGGKGPPLPESHLNYNDLSVYTEASAGKASFFIEVPYRMVRPDVNPDASNFGDINLGTKSLLVDCELLQFTFQFKTFLPTGNSREGLGTGHVSLDPSFLMALKLSPSTYLQGQLAYWIPLDSPGFQGGVVHYHASANHSLGKTANSELVGTLEFSGYSFTSGKYTDPVLPIPPPGAGGTYAYLGPGLRYYFCDRFDVGFGSSFALTNRHFADQIYRTEFRLRY